MRWPAWLALALVLTVLAGCFGSDRTADDPPVLPEVGTVRRHEMKVPSFDGTELAVVVHEPIASGSGSADARWPTVVFLHGWGGSKASWEGRSLPGSPVPRSGPGNNTLDAYARAGFLAVAYDARGFGESGGLAGVAGSDEIRDLQEVVRAVERRFPTTGATAAVGVSYGAGQVLQALRLPELDAATASYGWYDLADGLIPGNVPKLEWGQTLYTIGVTGTKGRLQPFVHDWYRNLYTREDLDTVRQQMALRDPKEELRRPHPPLFVCQGMQETLFPQADQVWEAASGPVTARIVEGGHGNDLCRDERMDFLQHHLQGLDTGAGSWPPLTTVDALGGPAAAFPSFPRPVMEVRYLRHPDLADVPSGTTFTIEQRLVGSPVGEPDVLWDASGRPSEAIPAQLRQDPTATVFRHRVDEPRMLLGQAELVLPVADDSEPPFQVAASLLVERGGRQVLLGRTAAAALDAGDLGSDRALVLAFPWTKAQLEPGDVVVLEVASNEPQAFMPLLAPYSVTFTGASRLALPHFEG